MIGEGVWWAIAALAFGMVLGWRRHRRALASRWARPGATVGAHEAPYRRSEQQLPVPGAERRITWRIAFVTAVALVGVGRAPLAWDAIVNLVDVAHVEARLVPADARGVVLVSALALQGAALAILLVRAADAVALRSERARARVRRAQVAALVGTALAGASAVVLWRAGAPSPIYWVTGYVTDELAYALLCVATALTLGTAGRASTEAPRLAPDSPPEPRTPTRRLVLEGLVAALAVGAVAHGLVHARARVQVDRELRGEAQISVAGASAHRSEDGRYSVWMPDDGVPYVAKHPTPFGEVDAERRHVWRKDAHLGLTAYERPAADGRSVDEICRAERDAIRGTIVAWSIRREEEPTSCEVVARVDAGKHLVRRIYVTGQRLYELEAEPVPSPAADLFLRSFTLHEAK